VERLRVAAILIGLAALLAGCGSGARSGTPAGGPDTADPPGSDDSLTLVEIVSGLEDPVQLTAADGEPGRLYLVEQAGRIRVVEEGRLLADPFLDITDTVTSGGERGLLSVAFHPRYASTRLFYVNYTDGQGDTRVVEYRAGSGVPPVAMRELLFVDQPYSNHNGGQLAFGPDGRLYVGTGDGGSGGDPENRAQDLTSPLGKLLRLDVDTSGSGWEIAGYGLRNPWRFGFDRETGDLYIADVGQGSLEEIDFMPASNTALVNYGWDVFEGSRLYEDKEPNPAGELAAPIFEYGHELGCSVTGGFVYRGRAVPGARGRYFFGDYCSGSIWSFVVAGGRATDLRQHGFVVEDLTSFGEGLDGELYLLSYGGTVYQLAAA
jgi:glucose/arabinose dehydrogenase